MHFLRSEGGVRWRDRGQRWLAMLFSSACWKEWVHMRKEVEERWRRGGKLFHVPSCSMKLSDSKTLRVVVSVCVCASCEEMGWPCDKEKSGWYKKLFSLYLHGTVWILKPCLCLNFEAVTAETSVHSETPELHQTGTFSLKKFFKKTTSQPKHDRRTK